MAEVSNMTPRLSAGTKSIMSNTSKFDLTLDDLTEFNKRQRPVPNHLTESKTFNRIGKNSIVKVTPAVVNFAGFTPGKIYRKVIRLCNASAEVQVIHIIPPDSRFFSIKYKKKGRFIPGTVTDVVLKFTPASWSYYYDCIRVHCKGEENLIIPINAFPVVDISKFPSKLNFTSPGNRLGRVISKTIPLVSRCPVKFEYEIVIVQSHPAFTVSPLQGVIPGNGRAEILVEYYPSEYSTAHMKMNLVTSQFNASVEVCEVIGVCSPPTSTSDPVIIKTAVRELLDELMDSSTSSDTLDPRELNPVARLRQSQVFGKQQQAKKQIDGYVVPSNIMTQHGVNSVLTQTRGKLRMKDLRDASAGGERGQNSRQIKQAEFERLIQQDVAKERANQLKWQVKLGDSPTTRKQVNAVKRTRVNELEHYERRVKRTPRSADELHRVGNERCAGKTQRRGDEPAPIIAPTFDLYRNNPWSQRQKAIFRFRQAVGTVIVRLEASRKIVLLRSLIRQFRQWQHSMMTFGSVDSLRSKIQQSHVFRIQVHNPSEKDRAEEELKRNFTPSNIACTAPHRLTDTFSVEAAEPTFGASDEKPENRYCVEPFYPYFDLCVPKYYENALYERQCVEEGLRNYIPPKLARKVRTGAEDELIYNAPEPTAQAQSSIEEPVLKDEAATFMSLKPPQKLMANPPTHKLHIFNRAPGVIVHPLPLPLAETDPGSHVAPEPRNGRTRPYLDRDDVIKGVMTWKRFSSMGLRALSAVPSVSDVWLPRRCPVPFVQPDRTPAFQQRLADDDRDCCDDSDDGSAISVTPAMVMANFACETQIRDEARVRLQEEEEYEQRETVNFPESEQLPRSAIAVDHCGSISLDLRRRHLETFIQAQKANVEKTLRRDTDAVED